jgi:hypothetical protein
MRKIKFRAWDNENKEMINPYCELRDNRFWGEDLTNTGLNTPISVMEFTGLTDKKGVDIYEGDILKSELDWVFAVKWDNENARFLGYSSTNQLIYVGREPKATVIGNIYENPELLY